jgi:hypothetical protein
MRRVFILLCLVLLNASCNTDKSRSNSFLKDIKDGSIKLLTISIHGPIYQDNKDRFTSRLLEHIKAKKWETLTSKQRLSQPEELYYIPKNIENFDLIKEYETESELYDLSGYGEDFYNFAHSIIYDSYEDFRISTIANAKDNEYEINESLQLIRHLVKIPEKRFVYKVQTAEGTETIEISWLKIDKEWKVGGIFKL